MVAGLAVDEYQHEFGRGDFLIRNLVGYDGETGALAVGAVPRPGQTIQFQVRDAATADLDLSLLLDPRKLLAIMKDGVFCKEPEMRSSRTRWTLPAA